MKKDVENYLLENSLEKILNDYCKLRGLQHVPVMALSSLKTANKSIEDTISIRRQHVQHYKTEEEYNNMSEYKQSEYVPIDFNGLIFYILKDREQEVKRLKQFF